MNDQLSMFDLETYPGTPNATSSPASADGATPCASQDGPTTGPCGPDRALASHSASVESGRASLTNDISGLYSSALSRSDDLQSSLESRLRERLTGSVSCEVTWSRWDTPWGQSRWRPRARTRTISGIDIGLWPTCTVHGNYNRKGLSTNSGDGLHTLVIACWPTAKASAAGPDFAKISRSNTGQSLTTMVIACWSTATATEARQGYQDRTRGKKGSQKSLTTQVVNIALWSTVRASDGEKGGPNMSFGAGGLRCRRKYQRSPIPRMPRWKVAPAPSTRSSLVGNSDTRQSG